MQADPQPTVRLGILGFGRMGRVHAETVDALPGASVVAVCDIDAEARRFADTTRSVPTFAEVSEFLDFPLDGVLIASSTRAHADHVRICAEAGVAVFTEKPVGLTMETADRALSAVVKAQVPFQIGYQRRWDPRYLEMRRLIVSGDIGEPVFFKAHGRDPDASAPSNWGLENNGGLFSNCAIHDYDAARFLLGAEVLSLTASGAVLVHSGLTACDDLDACSTTLFFDGGMMALTEWTRFASYGYDVRAEVIGTEGMVQLGTESRGGVTLRRRASERDSLVTHFGGAYRCAVAGFVGAIRSQSDTTPGVHDARAALQIALAARASYVAGSLRVDLPPLPELVGTANGVLSDAVPAPEAATSVPSLE